MRVAIALFLSAAVGLGLSAQEPKDKPAKKERPVAVDKDLLEKVEDKKPVLGPGDNEKEALAYNYLVLHASEVPADGLAKAARKDVTYSKLMEDPAKFRGEPIHVKGKLRRLIKMDATAALVKDGIKVLYEGWIFPETDEGGLDPYCVIFTELPKGVELGEKTFYRATCDAYFFKRYRYKAANNAARDAPLLIGRTFALQKSD